MKKSEDLIRVEDVQDSLKGEVEHKKWGKKVLGKL